MMIKYGCCYLTVVAALLLSTTAVVLAAPPTIPGTFTANVVATSSGTASGVPHGTKTYKKYYDYTNKRLREDFVAEGFTKIYRYDQKIEPPFPPAPHNPTFASPKGYKIQLRNGQPDPMSCCWLWLVDENGNADTMFQEVVPKKAIDAGAATVNGIKTEHWAFGTKFPFPQTSDFYFGSNNTLVQSNSFASIFKQGTVIGNSSFSNWDSSPIDVSVFAVPTSDPTFGKCKQCGVDPECSMQACTSG
eukprot:UC1_evm1s33